MGQKRMTVHWLSVAATPDCHFVVSLLQMVGAARLKEPWVSKMMNAVMIRMITTKVTRARTVTTEGNDVAMKGWSGESGSGWEPSIIRGKWKTQAALCKSKKSVECRVLMHSGECLTQTPTLLCRVTERETQLCKEAPLGKNGNEQKRKRKKTQTGTWKKN